MKFEQKEEYKYLWSLVSSANDAQIRINTRIKVAKWACYETRIDETHLTIKWKRITEC